MKPHVARDENGEVVKRPNYSDKEFTLYSLSGEKSLKVLCYQIFILNREPPGKAFIVSIVNLTYRPQSEKQVSAVVQGAMMKT